MDTWWKSTTKEALGLVFLITCVALPGNAVVVASNLGPGNAFSNNGILIENFLTNGEVTGFATSFVPSITATLQDVVLPLSTDVGGSLTVAITSDAAGQPGSVLALLTQNGTVPLVFSGGAKLLTFTCGNCLLLQANTRYWISAVVTNLNTDVTWNFSPSALGGAFFSNGSGNVGAVVGPWSTAGSTFPTPAFLVDGVGPASAPALSDVALGLVAISLAVIGAWILRREGAPNREGSN